MSRPHKRPVVFLAFANERDDRVRYLRNLPREASGLREVLDRESSQELWEVVERRNATLDEILDVFQDPRYRGRIVVFHFGGHAGSDELMLESSEGAGLRADAGIFVTFLRQQHSLRLAFLNGCSTQGQVKNLLAAGVPSVIATSRAIDDDIATRFAIRFYRGLAGGAGLRVAFEEAAASQLPGMNGTQRDVRDLRRAQVDVTDDDRWPWDLHVRDGADAIAKWSLGGSAGAPLLGLPPLPAMDLPNKPYRHLNWFGREHADLFFGRGREIRDLFEHLTSSHTPPITLLYGQSGVGKSSLLAAGLLGRLAAVSTTRYVRRDRDARLRSGLHQAVGVNGASLLRDAWVEAERTDGRPLIVLLDQVEEAFTRPHPDDPREIDDFLDDLCDLFLDRSRRPSGKLLLGFRKEWLADIEDRLVRLMLPHGKVFLEHLDAAGIAEAIAGPVSTDRLRSQYRLTIEDGLPERIAGDLLEDRGSPIAPALQLLLSKLWDRALMRSPDAPRFSADLYRELKREGVLLEDFLEQQLAALQAWQPELARVGLFLDFLAHHSTTIGSSRPRAWIELAESYRHHLDILPELVARARDLLLLVDAVGIDGETGDDDMTRLVHDAVAQLVRRRFEQSDLPGQQARRLLERRARGWADGAIGETLDDDDLSAIESGHVGMRRWTPDETRLVEASRAEREVRRAKERVATVLNALSTAREAKEDPLIAALLLAELADLPEPDEDVGPAIRIAGTPFPSSVLEGDDLQISHIAFSTDGTVLATGSPDGTARIWTLDGSGSCTVLEEHQDEITAIAFSPDGRLFATTSVDGTAVLHRVDRSRVPRHLFGHSGVVRSCAFSRDGRSLATASTDGTVRLWSCDGSAKPRVFAGHDGGARSAEFSPAGDALLTLDEAGHARVWNLITNSDAIALAAEKPIATALFRADGAVVSAGADGEIRLWTIAPTTPPSSVLVADALGDVPRPRQERGGGDRLGLPADFLCAAAYGLRIAHSGAGDLVIIRGLTATDEQSEQVRLALGYSSLPSPMPPQAAFALGAQIRAGILDLRGEHLLARCSDGVARVWSLADGGTRAVPLTHGGPDVCAIAFSLHGEHIATADVEGTVRLWRGGSTPEPRMIVVPDSSITTLGAIDAGAVLAEIHPNPKWGSTGVETVRIPLHGDGPATVIARRMTDVRISPDRARLLACIGRKLVVLSTVPSALPIVVADDFAKVRSREFTKNGTRLLVHTFDGTLHVWNMLTGEHEWKRRGIRPAKAPFAISFEGAFSDDAQLVVAVGVDDVARLLEIETGDTIWQRPDVVEAQFVSHQVTGRSSWVRLTLCDGTSRLRRADASGQEIPCSVTADGIWSYAAKDQDAEPFYWAYTPTAHKPWQQSVPFWLIDRADHRHLVENGAEWAQPVPKKGLFLVLLRNGELRVWRDDRWKTDAPGEGHLIDTDVLRFDVAPNQSRAVVRSRDGTFKLLDAEFSTVQRTLYPVHDWVWNADGSWIATWSAHSRMNEPQDTDAAPDGSWLVRVLNVEDGGKPITLRHPAGFPLRGWVDVVGSPPVQWFGPSHLAASVVHPGAPVTRLRIWDVRAPTGTHSASTEGRNTRRGFMAAPLDLTHADFSPDEYREYYDSINRRYRIEVMSYDAVKRLTVRHCVNVHPSVYTPLGSRYVSASDRDRSVQAHSIGDVWWLQIYPRVIANGRGSVEGIVFTRDELAVDVTLGDGQRMRLPVEGPTTHAWADAPDRIVSGFTAGDGSAVVMLMGDGTARLWRAHGSGAPLRVGVPGRHIRLRVPEGDAEPTPDIVVGRAGDPWITATLDDGSQVIWFDDGSDTPRPMTVPGRVLLEVATTDPMWDEGHQRRPAAWIAARFDDDTIRVWMTADPSVAITLASPGGRIAQLRRSYAGNMLDAILDDGARASWVIEGNRAVAVSPLNATEREVPDLAVSRDGRHAVRRVDGQPSLVRLFDAQASPVSLWADFEQRDQFEFSADGRWIVAVITDIDETNPWAVRVWNVDAPDVSTLIPHVELQRTQGNYLHLRRRTNAIDIVPFGGDAEPLTVPNNALVIDDDRVMYVASHGSEPRSVRSAVYVRRIDQSTEPLVLVPPHSWLREARFSDERVVALLGNGEICVWQLEWGVLAARVLGFTTVRLKPEQRRRLLGESDDEARSRLEREPPSRY